MDFLFRESLMKLLRIMRITLFLLFISVITTFADNSYAQETRLDIQFNNETVGSIIKYIESNSDFVFLYKNEDLNVHKRVNVNLKNASIEQILSEVLVGQDVDFNIYKRQVVIHKSVGMPTSPAEQETPSVSGKVTDSSGAPLPGVTIVIKGTTDGTITDPDGNYTLSDLPDNAVLVFSFVGMKTQEIALKGQSSVNVQMQDEAIGLNEVVAIGYGTIRKSDLTGSLATVSSDQFSEQNVTRLDQVLQGRATGIQISNTVGAPGGDVRIRIRGANSVLGDNNPLFVVDGFVGVDYNMLNPNDIKSVEVLKDAASTAIYGSRGANGVILITTKNGGEQGKVKVNYRGNVSLSSVVKKYDMLSAAEFAETVNAKNVALGLDPYFTQTQIDEYRQTGGFNYQDAVFREAVSTQHELSISGGTEKTQYRISGNYLDQDGIINNSGLKRYTFRTNILTKYNDKLSFRFNINGTSMTGLNTQARTGAGTPVVQALAWAPTTDPYDENGGYRLSDPVGSIKTNPLAIMYDTENRNERTFANLMGGVKYEFIDGLTLDLQAGSDLLYRTQKNFTGNYASNYSPGASVTNYKSINVQTTSQLSFNRTINEIHQINAVAVFETQKYTREYSSATASNLKFPELKYDNLAQAESYNIGSGFTKWTLLSYLGRVNYSLANKYLFSASVRRDGSSKFAPGNKYSTFPSVALAWNMANESFISNLDLFSKLKVRASWGLTGSQAISPYSTLSTYNTNIYYAFTTGDRTSGIQIGNPGNSELKWETTEQKDIGLEAGFFNGRLNVEFDYFVKDTRDLLLNQSVPYYSGGGSITANVGKIRNKGWEISLEGKIISRKNFSWESDLNLSNVKNRVVNLGEETQIFSQPDLNGLNGAPEFIYSVGHSLGSFWGLRYLGPWKPDQAQEAALFQQKPGDARYEDLNGDHVINGDDYQIIGCGLPTTSLGWNNTISVGNFDINLFLQGVFGIDKQNYTRAMHLMAARDARQATLAEIRERYIPGVQENTYLPAFSNSSEIQPQSTMFLEDASYVRLKNVSVGYNFKVRNIQNLKVYVSATNLLTFTNYKGIDPESSNVGGGGSDINQSLDYGSYPNSRTFTFGVDFTF